MSTRHLMARRQFLILSSTCAVAAATVGPRLFAQGLALPKRLAVGFAAFEENGAVLAASSIPASDGAFIGRGARVTVLGANGMPAAPRARRAVEVLAHYSYLDGAERQSAAYRAWGCSRSTGCQGNAVSFNVPVDEVQRVSLSFGIETGVPKGAVAREARVPDMTVSTDLPLTLSLQAEAGAFPLARGYYVIVPLLEGDTDPQWSSWALRAVDGRQVLVDAAGNTAPLEHFVIRVDYAF